MSAPASNQKHTSEAAAIGAQVAKAVAWVSGVFSLVACITLILAQIQIMQVDPLNDPTLKAMKAQITKDQKNEQLRDSVRSLHLLTRRAFFTNQQQQRATGVMLLFGVAVFLASMKTYVELRLKLPMPQGQAPREGGSAERAAGRWAVTAGAGLIVVATLLIVFISPPEFDLLAKPADKPAEPSSAPSTEGNPAKAEATATKKEEVKAAAADPSSAPGSGATEGKPDKSPGPKIEPPPNHAWPAFRGPYGNGVAGHAKAPLAWDGAKGENIAWKSAIPKGGTNSPIAWGDKVFIAGSDDQSRDVYAYEAKSGKLLWTGVTGLITGTLPKVMDGTTYVASTLATDGERVYAIFATSDVVAWNMDGTKAWGQNLGAFKNSYGHSSSLMLHGGKLLVQFDQEGAGQLLVLDCKNGKVLAKVARETQQASWASPIVVNTGSKWEAILLAKPFASSHDPLTGKLLWKVECMDGEVAPSPAFAAGRVFVGTQGMPLVAIQLAPEPKILWKYEDNLPDVSSPVATDKYVLMAASGGMVTCLDAATGKKVWEHEYEDAGFYASPILVGENAYLMDKRGVTFVLKLGGEFKQLAANPLGEKATCTPAIPEGRIYFRSEKNLYCVGKD